MPTVFGKYLLLRKLAEGGMAEVFLAKQQGPDGFEKLVVVKRILPHLGDIPEFVRMFVNEARIASRLQHGNIAQIYDLGRVGHAYFMAMEYVHGEDLAQIAKRAERAGRGPLPLGIVARIGIDVCGGLGYAHAALDANGRVLGIVHRDVSPQNVVATFDGGVKVIDFGVAKATAIAGETRAGMMKGKYAYMSPEQCRGERVDLRSDVFAIGTMLWELTAWRRLFKRDADYLTMRAVVEEPIPPASSLRSDAPPELDAILARALARDRDQRYASCEALAEELQELARKRKWDATRRSLSSLMHELFADKLNAQKQALRDARSDSLEDFLLKADENTSLDWIHPVRDPNDDEEMTMAATPPAKRASAVIPSVSVSTTPTPTPSVTETPPRVAGRSLAWIVGGFVLVFGAVGGWFAVRALGGDAERDRDAARAPAGKQVAAAPIAIDAAPAPAAARPARLVLRGQEGVLVFLDGRRRGTTPLVIDDTPFDRPRVLTLMKPGFKDRQITLPTIAAGDHVVAVTLEPTR